MVRIGINGFTGVGKIITRMAAGKEGVRVTTINEPLTDTDYLAYLLKYDSVYGRFSGRITDGEGELTVGNNTIRTFAKESPDEVDWSDCDVVIDTEKQKEDSQKEEKFFKGGAGKVIVSGGAQNFPIYAFGLNHEKYVGEKTVGYASPEATAVAITAKILSDSFGIENAIVTTLSAYNCCQKCTDGKNSKKWRDGRTATESVIPAVCGAANAAGSIFPELSGKMSGIALQVPVRAVSTLNFVCSLKTETDYATVTGKLKNASEGKLRNVFGVTAESVVSSDLIGCPLYMVADIRAGILQGGKLLKITGWYDGVWSHAAGMIKMAEHMMSF